jgi:hypothetical protein
MYISNPYNRKNSGRLTYEKRSCKTAPFQFVCFSFLTKLFFYKLLKGLEERFGFNGLCQMGVQACLQAAQQNSNGLFAVYGKGNLNKKQPC